MGRAGEKDIPQGLKRLRKKSICISVPITEGVQGLKRLLKIVVWGGSSIASWVQGLKPISCYQAFTA